MSNHKSTERHHIFDDGSSQQAPTPMITGIILALLITGGVVLYISTTLLITGGVTS